MQQNLVQNTAAPLQTCQPAVVTAANTSF